MEFESKAPTLPNAADAALDYPAVAAVPAGPDEAVPSPIAHAVDATRLHRMQNAVVNVMHDFANETAASIAAIGAGIPRAPISPLLRQLKKRKRPSRGSTHQDVCPPESDDDVIAVSRKKSRIDSTNTAIVGDDVGIVDKPDDPSTTTAPAEPPFEFVSAAVAAQRTGLPKGIIKTWLAEGLVGSLRPGSDASHRLVDLVDLTRFVEMKRERATNDARTQVEHEHKMRSRRTLLWVTQPPLPDDQDMDDNMSEADIELLCKPLEDKAKQMREMLRIDPKASFCAYEHAADANDLDRAGFEQVMMQLILPRKINRLVISDRKQVCSEAVWPLFEWLCRQHEIKVILAPLLAAASPTTGARDTAVTVAGIESL